MLGSEYPSPGQLLLPLPLWPQRGDTEVLHMGDTEVLHAGATTTTLHSHICWLLAARPSPGPTGTGHTWVVVPLLFSGSCNLKGEKETGQTDRAPRCLFSSDGAGAKQGPRSSARQDAFSPASICSHAGHLHASYTSAGCRPGPRQLVQPHQEPSIWVPDHHVSSSGRTAPREASGSGDLPFHSELLWAPLCPPKPCPSTQCAPNTCRGAREAPLGAVLNPAHPVCGWRHPAQRACR